MRFTGLTAHRLSRWSWIFFVVVEGTALIAGYFLGAATARESIEALQNLNCTSISKHLTLTLAFLGPCITNLVLVLLATRHVCGALTDPSESTLTDGPPPIDLPTPPWSYFFKCFSVSKRDNHLKNFQKAASECRRQILLGEASVNLTEDMVMKAILETNSLLSGLKFDGENILRMDTSCARLFGELHCCASYLSLALAYTALGSCSYLELLGQFFQFVSVTLLLFIAISTFAGFGTYKDLLYSVVSQDELEEIADCISVFTANTGRRLRGIQSNVHSSYVQGNFLGKYDIYVPVVSEHVVMRKIKVVGSGTVLRADSDGAAMDGLYLIGGPASSEVTKP